MIRVMRLAAMAAVAFACVSGAHAVDIQTVPVGDVGNIDDGIYGDVFQQRVKHMGIEEVVTAARSPWQNPYCERLVGSIRRECLSRVIILNERHLRRILRSYLDYYHHSRTHLSLARNSPVPREVELPELGKVISIPQVGGLHHRYCRAA